MNPIIAVDFNGALIKPRPFVEAHKSWFELFSVLLKDDSIKDIASKENYFENVHRIMYSYLGVSDKESQTIFAREIFSMLLLAEVTTHDLVKEFADYLRTLKDRYTLAVITSAPETSVLPMLRKLHCEDIFDIVFSSAVTNYPDKHSLFADFISKYDKPLFYIGLGDKYLGGLKELDVATISVNWVSRGSFRGDYEIDSVEELKGLL